MVLWVKIWNFVESKAAPPARTLEGILAEIPFEKKTFESCCGTGVILQVQIRNVVESEAAPQAVNSRIFPKYR